MESVVKSVSYKEKISPVPKKEMYTTILKKTDKENLTDENGSDLIKRKSQKVRRKFIRFTRKCKVKNNKLRIRLH